jgi:hypothetical protein
MTTISSFRSTPRDVEDVFGDLAAASGSISVVAMSNSLS